MIFSVLPSKSPATSSSSALNTAAESVSGPFVYNIVLDAGSTGSRIHIYKFKQQGKQLQLISDGFHQLKPGLSAFPDNPEQAAQSLKPLMAEAIKEVPTAQQVHGAWGRAAIVWVWVAAIVWVWVWVSDGTRLVASYSTRPVPYGCGHALCSTKPAIDGSAPCMHSIRPVLYRHQLPSAASACEANVDSSVCSVQLACCLALLVA